MAECPVCKTAGGTNPLGTHETYRLFACPECDVHFFHPRENPGAEWYERSDLYELGKTLAPTLTWYHRQFLADGVTHGPDLLDVGCGTGLLMSEAAKLGYRVTGFDFDQDCIRIARERHGLDTIHRMSVKQYLAAHPESKFDVVTFFEVLEHQDDPRGFLESLRHLLKPGGRIAFSVPNRNRKADPLAGGDFPPNHFTRWSAAAVRRAAELSGYRVEAVRIKPLGPEDIAGAIKARLRLGLARRLFRRGRDAGNPGTVATAAAMMGAKDRVLELATRPLAPLLRLANLEGTNLYCLARSA